MLQEQSLVLRTVKGTDLDNILSWGWYRQAFTTHFVTLRPGAEALRVYWLRYHVNAINLSRKSRGILAAGKEFEVSYSPLLITQEIEDLHARYAASLDFEINSSLAESLMDPGNAVFDTYLVSVRHEGKLIAGGIFDKGRDSIAGIKNFYDPAYKKYSPGKFLMLQKYKYCLSNNISLYYPGYFMTENPVFDYKLFLDEAATEVFIPEVGGWATLAAFRQVIDRLDR
jgi:arginine-tRNA-protein transferase